jgi:uncharacterized Zn finger protein (UPF0148 family)
MTEINCKECGVAFRPTRDWQIFCSTECRKDFNNREDRWEIYASKVSVAEREREAQMNGHSKLKVSIEDLSYARPRETVEVHRRRVATG